MSKSEIGNGVSIVRYFVKYILILLAYFNDIVTVYNYEGIRFIIKFEKSRLTQ